MRPAASTGGTVTVSLLAATPAGVSGFGHEDPGPFEGDRPSERSRRAVLRGTAAGAAIGAAAGARRGPLTAAATAGAGGLAGYLLAAAGERRPRAESTRRVPVAVPEGAGPVEVEVRVDGGD